MATSCFEDKRGVVISGSLQNLACIYHDVLMRNAFYTHWATCVPLESTLNIVFIEKLTRELMKRGNGTWYCEMRREYGTRLQRRRYQTQQINIIMILCRVLGPISFVIRVYSVSAIEDLVCLCQNFNCYWESIEAINNLIHIFCEI